MYRVTTPEPGYNGASCGVTFVNGVAEAVPDGPALRYFRNAGYGVEEIGEAASAASESADGNPPDSGEVVEGPVKPAGNASTDAWREYAVLKGIPAEEAEQMSRDEIKAKFNDDKESEVPS